MTDRKWYEDTDDLVSFAHWLHSECAYFLDVERVLHYFEKPWKWEREFGIWQAWLKNESPAFRERCIEAIDDDGVTAESLLAEMEESNAE